MPWDSASFDLLRSEVDASLRGARPPGGVPFFLYVYDPTEEVQCLRRFDRVARMFQGLEFHVQVVYMGLLIARVLQRTLYLSEVGKQAEARNPSALLRELSRPNGLPSRVALALLEGVEGVCEPLQDGSQNRCAILLRAGAAYPFLHISQILDALENRTDWTVVVPFPGSRHSEKPETLRFLNERDGPYYRARIIG